MDDERTRYREFTPWAPVVLAILWGVVLVSCIPLLAGWDSDLEAGQGPFIAAILLGLTGAIVWTVGGLTVLVQERRIVVHLGRLPLIRRAIAFDEIISLDAVEYAPIREFGGWGVRGLGRRKAWSARGSRAVALRLTGDREVLIGSDHPQRLEERIRTLAGIHSHD